MKVLIACEFSGTVREAFEAKGHDAWSCDLLDTETPGQHIIGDVLEILNDGWDLMIAHPPCTYLCSSGMHWTIRGLRDPKLTEDSLDFVKKLLKAPIEKIALENPIGCISTRIRKPEQIIQPWMFGHDASKATCLWLKNLPKLQSTKIVCPKNFKAVKFATDMPLCRCCLEEAYCEEHQSHFADCDCIGPTQEGFYYQSRNGFMFGSEQKQKMIWANQTPSGQNKLGPSEDRWAERSETYRGVAEAMAEQWGSL